MNTTTPTTETPTPVEALNPLDHVMPLSSSLTAIQAADKLEDNSYYRVKFQGKWRVGQFYKDQFFFPLSVNVWIHNCSAIIPIKIEMPQ